MTFQNHGEAQAWDRYAASMFDRSGDPEYSAFRADQLLSERRKRMGEPAKRADAPEAMESLAAAAWHELLDAADSAIREPHWWINGPPGRLTAAVRAVRGDMP